MSKHRGARPQQFQRGRKPRAGAFVAIGLHPSRGRRLPDPHGRAEVRPPDCAQDDQEPRTAASCRSASKRAPPIVRGDDWSAAQLELSRALGQGCLHRHAPSPSPIEARECFRVNAATRLAAVTLVDDAYTGHVAAVAASHQYQPRRWLERRDCSWANPIVRRRADRARSRHVLRRHRYRQLDGDPHDRSPEMQSRAPRPNWKRAHRRKQGPRDGVQNPRDTCAASRRRPGLPPVRRPPRRPD